jgi:hypothetical protein
MGEIGASNHNGISETIGIGSEKCGSNQLPIFNQVRIGELLDKHLQGVKTSLANLTH